MHRVPALWVVLLLSTTGAAAEISVQLLQQVNNSIQKMDATVLTDDWTYTQQTNNDGEITIATNKPSREKSMRLQLLEIDGQSPSAEQLRDFSREQQKRFEEEGQQDRSFATLIDVTTLQLVEQDREKTLLSFTPFIEELKDERSKLTGSLRLNNTSGLIDTISIINTEVLKPAFSVKLKRYQTRFSFTVVEQLLLLSHMSVDLAGKVGFFKSIDVDLAVEFSDHRRYQSAQYTEH